MMFWRYPKPRKKTAADQVNHFRKRCLERIGVILSQRELKRIMQEGKLAHLLKQSLSRSLFVLRKETYTAKSLKLDVVLAYDKSRHAFVTVMPYESWTKNHDTFGMRTDRRKKNRDDYVEKINEKTDERSFAEVEHSGAYRIVVSSLGQTALLC